MVLMETMKETIVKHRMIVQGDRIVVGFSGGPDSLAMIHALSKLRNEWSIEIIAVHINHMLRGEMANSDEHFVIEFCKALEIPCHTFRINVEALAAEESMSFEEAGRKVRYEKFYEVLKQYHGNKIAIAHNKNDVVETFFINLMRGSGIDGLSSIDYVRENLIIRPILDVPRFEVEHYCVEQGLAPRIDHTNSENHYLRNKIRNSILPMLNEAFEISCSEAIDKTVQIMKAEKDYWQIKQPILFQEVCTVDDRVIKVSNEKFNQLHLAEKQQLIRYAIKMLIGSLHNISFEVVQRIISLNRVGAKVNINTDYVARLSSDALYLFAVSEEIPESDELVKLYQRVLPISDMGQVQLSENVVAVDFDKIKGKLYARTRKPGDRFVPFGMKGHKKIKDFFIDEKVPFIKRESIQLVCDDEKIIWVENMRISDLVKITSETKNIIIISFQELVELN